MNEDITKDGGGQNARANQNWPVPAQENNASSSESRVRIYRSSDIYFCSFLASLDVPLATTESESMPDGGKKVVFVFKLPEADLQRLKASYFGGNGTVKARRFVDNIRSLKSMCFT